MSCLAPRPRTTVRREARFVLNSQVLDPPAQACAQPVGKSSCQGSSLSGHELLAVGTGGSQLQGVPGPSLSGYRVSFVTNAPAQPSTCLGTALFLPGPAVPSCRQSTAS